MLGSEYFESADKLIVAGEGEDRPRCGLERRHAGLFETKALGDCERGGAELGEWGAAPERERVRECDRGGWGVACGQLALAGPASRSKRFKSTRSGSSSSG